MSQFRTAALPVIVVGLAVCAAAAAQSQKNRTDLDRLKGKWQPTSMELGATKIPAEQLQKTSLTIDGEKYAVMAGDTADRGTLKIDAFAQPKTMDIVGTEGPNKGRKIPAIYLLEGDTLKICYALEGKRPTDFKTGGDKILIATYKRVNP
jgi:uncharacterized protein (TIGR03067 family)